VPATPKRSHTTFYLKLIFRFYMLQRIESRFRTIFILYYYIVFTTGAEYLRQTMYLPTPLTHIVGC